MSYPLVEDLLKQKLTKYDSCVICAERNKNLILLGNVHHDGSIVFIGQREKLEIVFYNKTKSGVNHVDQLAQFYNTARRTQRWPLAIFFYLLNISVIKASAIHYHNSDESFKRKNFMKNHSISAASTLFFTAIRVTAIELKKDVNFVLERKEEGLSSRQRMFVNVHYHAFRVSTYHYKVCTFERTKANAIYEL
ncbi:hypothetical protein T4A_6246 [Trichinella pseudospiralis]|uniref:PiggyBac transposable element-derived protein domain-containing protein n=1 Tax=Trichinella pseudospiralis TaxID=6337 RepID=A0A0V1F119_TRIPS|nr:hypothetical protein T4A_6246 [Trichinella pseudospiralis]